MAAQFSATRQANVIDLHLSPAHPTVPVPVELREEISPDVWASRLASITQTASRYNKPLFERTWMLVGLLAIFIVPIAIFQVILKAIHVDDDTTASHVFEARGISLAIFVALVLFFFVPMAVWKYTGQKQVNSMLKKWEKVDRPGAGSLPRSTWTVKTPGVFKTRILLRIQLPPGKAVSAFTFDAYLPSYINGPADPEANYYYPYKAAPGLPRMSVVGNVPLFADEKRGYVGSEKV